MIFSARQALRRWLHAHRETFAAILILLALDLAFNGSALFSSSDALPCSPIGDAAKYFAPMREFGYAEMAHGNVPLWNPYIFCGTPYLAACQPAIFYPPNIHYFFLPLAKAMALEIALHMFLFGSFVYAWARFWRVPRTAAVFAGTVCMLGGPYLLHVFAGHFSLIDSWPWAALAFLSADAYIETRRARHVFTGGLALTMAILAGHPQAAFESSVVLVLYAALRSAGQTRRFSIALGVVLMLIAPAILGAAQVWPTIQLLNETTRAAGLTYTSATSYSFPPENLLTAFAPVFFGDVKHTPYWGRWLYWEMSAFTGITTLALAGYGMLRSRYTVRYIWLVMIAVTLIVSFGGYTPLFAILWRVIPGLGFFRSPSKFIVFTAMFTAMLAGLGAREILERPRKVKPMVYASMVLAAAFFVTALWVRSSFATGTWTEVLSLTQPNWRALPKLGANLPYLSAHQAVVSLVVAAFTCAVIGVLFAGSPRFTGCRAALLVLGIVEILVFAVATRDSLKLSDLGNDGLVEDLARLPRDMRVYDRRITDVLLYQRTKNIWGYDPVILRRYRELTGGMEATQTAAAFRPERVRRSDPLLATLCCAYVVDSRSTSEREPKAIRDPRPRFSFPASIIIEPDRERRLKLLDQDDFDWRDTVILESDPVPVPAHGGATGTVTVITESSDSITIDVSVNENAVLLMADAYASGWKIHGESPAGQQFYTLMPANHALRAIPLAGGHHVLTLTYAPMSFPLGAWVSLLSLPIFAAAWVFAWKFDVAIRPGGKVNETASTPVAV